MDLNKIDAALVLLQAIDSSAIIAGGFPRDMVYGVTPKDIDFFVSHDTTLEMIQNEFPEAKRESYAEWLAYSGNDVADVINLGVIGGIPAQVIRLTRGSDPLSRMKEHDFGFCQIASFNVMRPSKLTSAFVNDYVNNTVTLIHCEDKTQFDRSMHRWERLQKKYPSKRLVIPAEFQQFVTQPQDIFDL